MNLILSGLQNSGKTTVGQLLATKLEWDFIDTDRMIENQYGQNATCREIFIKKGESTFRALEKKAIDSLKELKNYVIATGGGSLVNPENRSILEQIGTFVYLKANPELLWTRIDAIPAHLDQNEPKKSFLELAKNRIPIYESMAHYTIETDTLTPEQIVDMILNKLIGDNG